MAPQYESEKCAKISEQKWLHVLLLIQFLGWILPFSIIGHRALDLPSIKRYFAPPLPVTDNIRKFILETNNLSFNRLG